MNTRNECQVEGLQLVCTLSFRSKNRNQSSKHSLSLSLSPSLRGQGQNTLSLSLFLSPGLWAQELPPVPLSLSLSLTDSVTCQPRRAAYQDTQKGTRLQNHLQNLQSRTLRTSNRFFFWHCAGELQSCIVHLDVLLHCHLEPGLLGSSFTRAPAAPVASLLYQPRQTSSKRSK